MIQFDQSVSNGLKPPASLNHYKDPYEPTSIMESNKVFFSWLTCGFFPHVFFFEQLSANGLGWWLGARCFGVPLFESQITNPNH